MFSTMMCYLLTQKRWRKRVLLHENTCKVIIEHRLVMLAYKAQQTLVAR